MAWWKRIRKKKDTFCAYIYKNFEVPGLTFTYVEDDITLVPGIELVLFKGHSPGVLGLVLHAESGTYIFPSDAVYTQKNYGPPVIPPGKVYDIIGFYGDVRKLNRLEKQYNAQIIYSHDFEQFRTLEKAPVFY